MDQLLEWDGSALLWINSHHNPVLDAVLAPISFSGEVGAVWILLFLGMMVFGKREHRIAALTFMLTILVVDRVICPLFKDEFFRVRPYEAIEGIRQWGHRWGGGSFPSGHAHSVWIGAIVLSDRWRRLSIPLAVYALLTCYSRPYFGMHYPLDVIGGSIIGIVSAFIVVIVQHLLRRRYGVPAGSGVLSCGEDSDDVSR